MQYFFHIRVSGTFLIDEEGLEFPDIYGARAEMRASAIDLTEAALRKGPGVEGGVIELEDETGNIVEVFPIRTVLH
jgi:hypothetical protein